MTEETQQYAADPEIAEQTEQQPIAMAADSEDGPVAADPEGEEE